MSNIEVGEWIRTADGIRKILEINTGNRKTYYGQYILDKKYKGSCSITEKNIVNHSKELIDLIEKDDFVNGKRVIKIMDYEEFKKICFDEDFDDVAYEKDIKSIVTKEMFLNAEYKVGE